MGIETIEKIRVRVSLKTDGGFYPAGTILFAPFPEDLMHEIVLGNTIEVLWDSAVGIDGEPVGSVDPPSGVKEEIAAMDEKKKLEAYISMIDPGLNFDRRKSVKTLRKQVTRMVMNKAKEYGQVLDSKVGVDILMKEFLDLQAAVDAIEDQEI